MFAPALTGITINTQEYNYLWKIELIKLNVCLSNHVLRINKIKGTSGIRNQEFLRRLEPF